MSMPSVFVKLSIGTERMPLRPILAWQGSAITVGVVDVPSAVHGCPITSVGVRLTNTAGAVTTIAAKQLGDIWTATFPASFTATAGKISRGVLITLGGKDENETDRVWYEAVGDMEIAAQNPSATPGESYQMMKWHDSRPSTPVRGDVAPYNGAVYFYNGSEWISFGSQGSCSWDSITGKPSSFTPSAHAATHATGAADAISPASIGAQPTLTASTGIDATSLAANTIALTSAVQTSLGKADTALQSTDIVTPSPSAAANKAADAKRARDLLDRAVYKNGTQWVASGVPSDVTLDPSGPSRDESYIWHWRIIDPPELENYDPWAYNGEGEVPVGTVLNFQFIESVREPFTATLQYTGSLVVDGTKTLLDSSQISGKLDTTNGDASVGWNDDGNLAVSGGKFVGSFDGEFMAAAWNDYQIDLGGGETADLPTEIAAQIGNHNTADNPHSGKFDAAGAATSAVTTHNSSASAHSSLFAAKQDTISDLATIRSGASAGATALQSTDIITPSPSAAANKAADAKRARDLLDRAVYKAGFTDWVASDVPEGVTLVGQPTFIRWGESSSDPNAGEWRWYDTESNLHRASYYYEDSLEVYFDDFSATRTTGGAPVVDGTKTLVDSNQLATQLDTKQDTLTEGTGISIDSNTISTTAVRSFTAVGGVTPTVSSGVANLSTLFSGDNTSNNADNVRVSASDSTSIKSYTDTIAKYPINTTATVQDRAINVTSAASVTVPDTFTDLIFRATVASSLAVTVPSAITSKYGDAFPSAAGEYLVCITKLSATEAYVRTIKLEAQS